MVLYGCPLDGIPPRQNVRYVDPSGQGKRGGTEKVRDCREVIILKIIDNADKQKIYESLARELRFIREMVMKIYCDKDYLSLLGKTRMSGLSRAENQIYRCILEAEEYWVRDMKSAGTRIFMQGFTMILSTTK